MKINEKIKILKELKMAMLEQEKVNNFCDWYGLEIKKAVLVGKYYYG